MTRRRGRPAPEVHLVEAERAALERLVRARKTSQAIARRASIVLALDGGRLGGDVATEVGVSQTTVTKWRNRYLELGLEGLADAWRSGQPRKIGDDKVQEVVRLTIETTPKGRSRWSTRAMAEATGVNRTRVSQIWRAFGLQPHRRETFQLSTDPEFVAKTRDVCGP